MEALTPFTCPREHKHADSSTCYIQHRCRCLPCRAGSAARANRRARLKAYGRFDTGLVDAGPAREHIAQLQANGYGYKRIADLTGVGRTAIRDLIWGRQEPGPRRGEHRARIARDKADRILALHVDYATLADGAKVSARGTHRRLHALIAVGWSQAKLAARLGVTPGNFGTMLRQEQVLARLHRRVAALYDELWDQAPVLETKYDRIAYSRARNAAAAHGWLPPLAWDDIDHDAAPAPLEQDDVVDDLAVQLVVQGHRLQLTRLERQAAVAALTDKGHSTATIAARLGITDRTVTRDRNEAGKDAGEEVA